MSAQDRTLDRYQELMQINAAGHVLRSAREIGLFAELSTGQKTIEQLIDRLSLSRETTELLLDCLVSMNVVERYGDDHALSQVMRLLCEHDSDLGDSGWAPLAAKLQQQSQAANDQRYRDAVAATQWIHTPAAMQAAEILDIGSSDPATADHQTEPLQILDLGCGSAVWSCAMAYRDPRAEVLAVDHPAALVAAEHTARSIDLGQRFRTLAGTPETVELPPEQADLTLIAQRLHSAPAAQGERLLEQAIGALKPGGQLVVIDLFRSPSKPRLSETIEALRLHVSTEQGRVRTIAEAQSHLERLGLKSVQFTFIAASRINLGIMVGTKPVKLSP